MDLEAEVVGEGFDGLVRPLAHARTFIEVLSNDQADVVMAARAEHLSGRRSEGGEWGRQS